MLRQAKETRVSSLSATPSRETKIRQVLEAEVDVICVNFGWNAGGSRGVGTKLHHRGSRPTVRGASSTRYGRCGPRPSAWWRAARSSIRTTCYRVCRDAKADGYVGGSTLDRLPLELSVMQVTSAFKAISVLREADQALSKEIAHAARLAGVAGQSDAIRTML